MTRSRARLALIAAAAVALTGAVTAGVASGAPGGGIGPADAAYVHGAQGLVRLGDRLPAVAERYGLAPGELQRMLREDPTLQVDRGDELAYFDVLEPADLAGAEPAAAAADGDPFSLSSLPGADKTIYLDFDGHTTIGTTWNSQNGISTIVSPPYDRDGDSSTFNAEELSIIEATWAIVAEDFAPWNVNVTTIDPGAAALSRSGSGDTTWGSRVVITEDWQGCGCGGFAYLGSFDDSTDEPVFVFNTSLRGVAEASSHEVGHAMLLNHDGLASGTTYYGGHNTADTPGWAPIMGASYNQPVTQWSRQEYFGANNTGEDDTAIIGSLTNGNGFGVRADDHGDNGASATPLVGQQVEASGVIETRDDVDAFSFTTAGGGITFNAYPDATKANLDIELTLRSVTGAIVAQDNGPDALLAGFDADVPAGDYVVEVRGVGVGNPAANPPSGYTDYGSLGQYTLLGYTGPVGPPDTTPPAAPTGATATLASSVGDVVISWDANTETDLSTYTVYRTDAAGTPISVVDTVPAGTTSTVDTSASVGTNNYVVSATATSGNESRYSNIASVDVPEPDVTAPATPTGLTATEADGDITLSWNPNGELDLAGYRVKRSSSATGPYNSLGTVGSGVTSFVDAAAPIGDSFYVVTAFDGTGNESDDSAIASANVPEPPPDLTNNAIGDTAVAGTVSGSFAATTARDGNVQSITEVESGGRKNQRHDLAEHRWRIPASSGNQTLTVVASASTGGDADAGFAVEWSTDGSAWVPFATAPNGSSIDVTDSIGAPTGNVFVRVIDTDRSRGNTSLNTISVDFLEVGGDGDVVEPPTATSTVASLSTSTQSAGRGSQFGVVTVQVTTDLGDPVSGATVIVALSGSFSGDLTGVTNPNGVVTLRTTDAVKKPSFTACVAEITGAPLPYQPGTEGC